MQKLPVAADDLAAAGIAGEGQKLGKEGGGEQGGIAPPLPIAEGADPVRVGLEGPQQGAYTPGGEPGLIAHAEEDAVQVQTGPGPQSDRGGDPPGGVRVGEGEKARLPAQGEDGLILAHHHPAGKGDTGVEGERPLDQGHPLHRQKELVGAKAPAES